MLWVAVWRWWFSDEGHLFAVGVPKDDDVVTAAHWAIGHSTVRIFQVVLTNSRLEDSDEAFAEERAEPTYEEPGRGGK